MHINTKKNCVSFLLLFRHLYFNLQPPVTLPKRVEEKLVLPYIFSSLPSAPLGSYYSRVQMYHNLASS